MKKRILTLAVVLALVATMVVPVSALASNEAGQAASTFTTTIEIVDKVGYAAVETIMFPPGAPGATVSNPVNNVNGLTDFQVVAGTGSEPVVRLRNNTAGDLVVWLAIADWTNDVVVSEDYELVDTGTTTVDVVDNVLSSDGNAALVPTGISIPASGVLALYLEIVLCGTPGIIGGSQLYILGGAP
jgi:hypothetical protein